MWFSLEKATLEWTGDAPISISVARILDASPAEAFEIFADTDTWSEWLPGCEGAEWLSDGEPGVGARRLIELELMNAREEFLAWEPGERFTFALTATSVPFARRMIEDYRLAPLEDGRCKFTWDIYVEPRWFLRPIQFLLRRQFETMFEQSAAALAKYIRRD